MGPTKYEKFANQFLRGDRVRVEMFKAEAFPDCDDYSSKSALTSRYIRELQCAEASTKIS